MVDVTLRQRREKYIYPLSATGRASRAAVEGIPSPCFPGLGGSPFINFPLTMCRNGILRLDIFRDVTFILQGC